jgi:DNA-binding NtrC family response regulator
MQTDRQTGTVILVSSKCPEATVELDIGANGLEIRWASSIRAALELLSAVSERTIIVTELALADGNWRDLVERVSSWVVFPIVLLTPSSTAELWWDALECGVNDILHTPVKASSLCDLLETHYSR